MSSVATIGIALTGAVVLVSMYTDLRYGKILNRLVLPCIPLGLLIWGLGQGWDGVLFSLQGIAIGSVALLVAGALRWIGPGDAKLMVAIGALNGPTFVLYTAGFGAIAGGVMALAVLLRRRMVKTWTMETAVAILSHLPIETCWADRAGYIPYSIAIAIGALAAALYT